MEGFLHSRGSPCLHAPQRFLSQTGREYGGYRIRSLESVFIDWPADDVLLAQPSRKNETSVFECWMLRCIEEEVLGSPPFLGQATSEAFVCCGEIRSLGVCKHQACWNKKI